MYVCTYLYIHPPAHLHFSSCAQPAWEKRPCRHEHVEALNRAEQREYGYMLTYTYIHTYIHIMSSSVCMPKYHQPPGWHPFTNHHETREKGFFSLFVWLAYEASIEGR